MAATNYFVAAARRNSISSQMWLGNLPIFIGKQIVKPSNVTIDFLA